MRPAMLECGWSLPSRSVSATIPGRVLPPDPTHWPTLWARCWSRIRSWQVPPRWSAGQFQRILATRGIPLEDTTARSDRQEAGAPVFRLMSLWFFSCFHPVWLFQSGA
jgi:hypothetical protein